MWNAFKYFDIDSDGFISFDDLEIAFTRSAIKISKEELVNMLVGVGKDINSKIDFETFRILITNNEKIC